VTGSGPTIGHPRFPGTTTEVVGLAKVERVTPRGSLFPTVLTPFSFHEEEYRFTVDPLPIDWNAFVTTQAFGTYLLGHDDVADHDIHLHSRQPNGTYTLDWTGRIALTYSGDDEFTYQFQAHATGVRFREIRLWYFHKERAMEYLGIDLDPSVTPRDYIAPFVTDSDEFVFEERVDPAGHSCFYAIPNS
jgi:hypothetical protein